MKLSFSFFVLSLLVIMVYYLLNIRDVIYLIPILSIANLIQTNNIKVEKSLRSIILLFAILFLFTLIGMIINSNVMNIYSVKQATFTLLGLFSSFAILNKVSKKQALKVVEYFCYLMLVVETIKNPASIIKLISNPVGFFIYSESDSESISSFIYGSLFLSFFISKNKKMTFVTSVLLLYGGKRIVILSVLASILLSIIYFKKNREKPYLIPIVFVGLSILYLVTIQLLIEGYFDYFILKNFGVSANFLLKGRVYNYSSVVSFLGGFSLLGSGPGYITYILKSGMVSTTAGLLHSDILRIVLEYGIIMSLIIFGLLGKVASNNKYYFSITIYLFILLFSDNVFIYFEVIFMNFMLAILFGRNQDEY